MELTLTQLICVCTIDHNYHDQIRALRISRALIMSHMTAITHMIWKRSPRKRRKSKGTTRIEAQNLSQGKYHILNAEIVGEN